VVRIIAVMVTMTMRLLLINSGYDLVTVHVYKNRLLAASNGKFYELNPGTGSVIWRDNLKGYSYSHIYLGNYATYGYTDHNSTTIVQFIAEGRRSNQ
jgi:outer membrane protein assembly factor BamB